MFSGAFICLSVFALTPKSFMWIGPGQKQNKKRIKVRESSGSYSGLKKKRNPEISKVPFSLYFQGL